MTGDADLALAVIRDYRDADLDAPTRALMDYAVLVTRNPSGVADSTIAELRGHGWNDAEILTATEIIGFFNYYARLAESLRVDPEDFMVKDVGVWPKEGAPGRAF
ncbi:MAG: carboxymuconolactone decarboxylase family protein [Gemmatimonadota bacterium]